MTQVTREIRRDRGSVLIIAVITMLILSVLGVSFAMLARIETTIGFNYKQQAQAEALAEAALDRARDTMRGAATANDGFTAWLNASLWGGGAQTPPAYTGSATYWYRARVDNDCALLNTVPASIEEAVTCADAALRNTTDGNDTAVVTAWGQAGTGRTRVRAILSVDNAWRHVCSDAQGRQRRPVQQRRQHQRQPDDSAGRPGRSKRTCVLGRSATALPGLLPDRPTCAQAVRGQQR